MASHHHCEDGYFSDDSSSSEGSILDLAYLDQDDESLNDNLKTYSVIGNSHATTRTVLINHNRMTALPSNLSAFLQLTTLDISSNHLSTLPVTVISLNNLNSLIAKHNNFSDDTSLPKNFQELKQLQHVNLAGNRFKAIPPQLLEIKDLKTLHLGGNELNQVSSSIIKLTRLEVLYLGGNQLTEVPSEIGSLSSLQALYLCENKLECLPSSIVRLRRLKSLALHHNRLKTLPPEIVKLRSLTELSLRDNPLVVHFVRDMAYDPPSLMELAARTIKIRSITFPDNFLPHTLVNYLSHAQQCVNPKCKGVYFDAHVENIKFVDFCGKYHLPLLQYLCSTNCDRTPAVWKTSSDSSESEEEDFVPTSRLQKVLLG